MYVRCCVFIAHLCMFDGLKTEVLVDALICYVHKSTAGQHDKTYIVWLAEAMANMLCTPATLRQL